ncbi:hypothetical protein LINGRAHAP2_LOCUS1453 [Linum grandiflorum]
MNNEDHILQPSLDDVGDAHGDELERDEVGRTLRRLMIGEEGEEIRRRAEEVKGKMEIETRKEFNEAEVMGDGVENDNTSVPNAAYSQHNAEDTAGESLKEERVWVKLRFKSDTETYSFYNDYGKTIGFDIRKMSRARMKLKESGQVHYLKYA